MPGIVAGALVAHPPILLAEVGGVQSSMTSLPVRRGANAGGNLARFRAPHVQVAAQVDVVLADALIADGRRAGFSLIWAEETELDHGVVVPLHSLPRTMANKRCIFLGVSGWPLQRFVEFGSWLHGWLRDRAVILIASGDLSHRLTADAPYGYRPEGPVFDRLVIDALRDRDWKRIEGLNPDLIEEAGECGLRPLGILLGAAQAAGLSSQVLSYEGPFGVGYPVVAFTTPTVAGTAPNTGLDIQALGRRAIDTYLRTRRLIEPPQPIPVELQAPSAVFVSLRKDGELRGCVGSVQPTEATAAHALIRYAVASALRDPRFEPVRLDEVAALTIKVQLLDPPEPTELSRLNPHTHGIIVRRGDRQALLLPGIEGIDTPEQQLRAACEKAGINPNAPLGLERFRTRMLE
ncbi:MAG: AmmeMemoRadiSam system protein A [Chloroflexota bacterium]|nr:MAG: AmmeMemoRadiSam system protein A [Chloroflexota bacterium]